MVPAPDLLTPEAEVIRLINFLGSVSPRELREELPFWTRDGLPDPASAQRFVEVKRAQIEGADTARLLAISRREHCVSIAFVRTSPSMDIDKV